MKQFTKFLILCAVLGIVPVHLFAGNCSSIPRQRQIPIEGRSPQDLYRLFRGKSCSTGGGSVPIPLELLKHMGSFLHLNLHPENSIITRRYKKALQGNANAQYLLGSVYDRQIENNVSATVSANDEEAFYWYSLAADQEHVEALVEVGKFHFGKLRSKKNYTKAFEYFGKAASSQNAEAQFYLGQIFEIGYGVVAVNIREARKLYAAAFQAGELDAAFSLFRVCMQAGDVDQAISLLELDGVRDDPFTLFLKGIFVEKGLGFKKDTKEAMRLFRAAEPGLGDESPEWFFNLGILYAEGNLFKKDKAQALACVKRSLKLWKEDFPALDDSDLETLAVLAMRSEEFRRPEVRDLIRTSLSTLRPEDDSKCKILEDDSEESKSNRESGQA